MAATYGRHLSFPFRVGTDGRTAQVAGLEDHVREELKQLILTNPGERLFLPQFGGGVRRLVFENLDATAVGLTKATLTEAIRRWLGHRIELEDVQVVGDDARLEISIKYRLPGTTTSQVLQFQRQGEPT